MLQVLLEIFCLENWYAVVELVDQSAFNLLLLLTWTYYLNLFKFLHSFNMMYEKCFTNWNKIDC